MAFKPGQRVVLVSILDLLDDGALTKGKTYTVIEMIRSSWSDDRELVRFKDNNGAYRKLYMGRFEASEDPILPDWF